METSRQKSHPETPVSMVIMSILAIIIWALFILVYALFWSNGFSLFQNIIVTIVSLMITGLAIGLIWVVWEGRRKGGML